MIHFTLALAILITAVAVKPLYMAFIFAAGLRVDLQFHHLQALGEILPLAGLLIAWIIIHLTKLACRVPGPVPGRWALVLGVWVFFAVLAATLARQFSANADYLIEAFPAKYLLDSPFTWPFINAVLLYGVGTALLSAGPEKSSND